MTTATGHPRIDLDAIFTAAFASRDAEGDHWHDNPGADGVWRWHASKLSACPRQLMLERAGLATDGTRLESLRTFAVGHAMHELIQLGAERDAAVRLIGAEMGGWHPLIPLAARADLLLSIDGRRVIAELKTESSFAGKHRRAEAIVVPGHGRTTARVEHRFQLAAQAVVLEALGHGPIDAGVVIYIDKESGGCDQQPAFLDRGMRADVLRRVEWLEGLWAEYVASQRLPARIPAGPDGRAPWQCRARSKSDPRGMYCPARVTCFSRES